MAVSKTMKVACLLFITCMAAATLTHADPEVAAEADAPAADAAALAAEVELLRKWKVYYEGEVAKHTEEVAALKSQAAASEAEVQALRQHNAVRATEIANLQKELAQTVQQLAASAASLSAAQAEIAAMKSNPGTPFDVELLIARAKALLATAHEKAADILGKVVMPKVTAAAGKAKLFVDKHLPGLTAQVQAMYDKAQPMAQQVQERVAATAQQLDTELRSVLQQSLGKVEALKPYVNDPVLVQALVYAILGLPATALVLGTLACCCRRTPAAASPRKAAKLGKARKPVVGQHVKDAAGKPLPVANRR